MDVAQLVRRLRPAELYAFDALVAAIAVLICLTATFEAPGDGRPTEPVWVSVLTGLAIGLPIAVRRRWPTSVAVIVTAASSFAFVTEFIPPFASPGVILPLVLAFYTFGTVSRDTPGFTIQTICAVLISVGLSLPDLWTHHAGPPEDVPSDALTAFFGMLVVMPAFILGFAIGERRSQNAQRSDQARREAVMAERLRLARELHDVIAHTVTLMVVKASIGNVVAETDPAEARDALRVIEKTGRSAMVEVRRVLDMLRDETPDGPMPGLDDLPGLVEQASAGDARVTLTVDRPATAAISESVQLAVYRIVQEAVTNVVKHAAPAHCRVSVVVGGEDIRVDVDDDGRRTPRAGGAGHGLIGMRERVALHGGSFSAGPRDGGGFSVTALLPVTGHEREDGS
ncbi:sensor histidine kinase [Actinoplanes oblitus]|uniref:histidine kinase n=1 Tax=Actinoplanes oblitus TaxID=3040509 RepID=A0ABY8WQJ6_9ACTN|nr:sensor histidine kinase [Actinoplanes oblitus]WIM99363.1 sensor histidine kinase [Actinoplanes oblitus]